MLAKARRAVSADDLTRNLVNMLSGGKANSRQDVFGGWRSHRVGKILTAVVGFDTETENPHEFSENSYCGR